MKHGSDSATRATNVLGVAAGVLMLVLPFLGPWWIARAGADAIAIALSPFDLSISVLGQPVHSNLVELFLLAEKIAMIIAGVFMISGSLSPNSWWAGRLVRFGVMKPFWAIVGLVVLIVFGTFLINSALPSLLSNAVQDGGTSIQLSIPYLVGSSSTTIQIGSQATITAPVNLSLAPAFWVAVVTAVLGVMARISHRRFQKR